MDNTTPAHASSTDNDDQQANATSHTAGPSDHTSPTQNEPSTSTAEEDVPQHLLTPFSAQDQQILSLVEALVAEAETPVRLEDLLALSEDLRTFDVGLHQIERACSNFMRELDRSSLTPDVRAAVALADQTILQCQHAHALQSLTIVNFTAALVGGPAEPTIQQLQLGLYRLEVCRRALITMRRALAGREFQLWILGEAVLHAEVKHDLEEWALTLTQTTTRFIRRRPWLSVLIGELSSRQSLEAACALDLVPEPPTPQPRPQEQDHPGTEEHEPRDLDGDCMICTTALMAPSIESTVQSPSLLATCQTCNHALHLHCVLTWWRMPVTQGQARKCPLCRAIVTDEYYIGAVRRYTAWMVKLMDDAGNGN